MAMIISIILTSLMPFSTISFFKPFFVGDFLEIYSVKGVQKPIKDQADRTNLSNPKPEYLANRRLWEIPMIILKTKKTPKVANPWPELYYQVAENEHNNMI